MRPDVGVLRFRYQMSASSSEKIGCKYSSREKYDAENSQAGNRDDEYRIIPASGFCVFVFFDSLNFLEIRFLHRCFHR